MSSKKILVPVTLENEARHAFGIAARLARSCGASITLLHSVNLAIVGEERGIGRARLIEEMRFNAERQLRVMAARESAEILIDVIVREGDPAAAILEEANRMNSDTIIMAAHTHRRWLKWLHRNTALTVLKNATCPVWLLAPANQNGTGTLLVMDPVVRPVTLADAVFQNN